MSEGRTSHTHPLKVDFIDDERFSLPGRIGMTFAPGKKKKYSATGPWDRQLDEDLQRLRKKFRTDLLVSLIEEHEFAEVEIEGLRERAPLFGLEVLWFPIRDVSVPKSIEQFNEVVETLVERLRIGETIVIHCMGGLGRTGVMAAACLVAAIKDLTPEEAIDIVRRARPGTLETPQQEEYISEFKGFLSARSTKGAELERNEETEQSAPERDRRNFEAFAGCLLGGAVGDALGAPVEFLSLSEIRKRFGNSGIQNYIPAYGRLGAITDDTQMTLFTAEGLLRAHSRWMEKGICHVPSVVHHAYIRWLHTQGHKSSHSFSSNGDDGWLIKLSELHQQRAPGNTCLGALLGAETGTMEKPLNDSKGCGGVMRVAPVGLFASEGEAFELGCELAALTHGHPSGYLAAGTLSAIIAHVVAGKSLEASIAESLTELQTKPHHEECFTAFQQALSLWRDNEISPSPETVERLGGGWVGEEALAISLYCSLVAQDDFRKGIVLAVNHGGDSDSTGAITGNILGALLGWKSIPAGWLESLEVRNHIEEIAGDLLNRHREDDEWGVKYPGW